jgi:hypothetical protein
MDISWATSMADRSREMAKQGYDDYMISWKVYALYLSEGIDVVNRPE